MLRRRALTCRFRYTSSSISGYTASCGASCSACSAVGTAIVIIRGFWIERFTRNPSCPKEVQNTFSVLLNYVKLPPLDSSRSDPPYVNGHGPAAQPAELVASQAVVRAPDADLCPQLRRKFWTRGRNDSKSGLACPKFFLPDLANFP